MIKNCDLKQVKNVNLLIGGEVNVVTGVGVYDVYIIYCHINTYIILFILNIVIGSLIYYYLY